MLRRQRRTKSRKGPLAPMPEVRQAFLDFKDGLDQLTPSWKVNPGSLRDCRNFEIAISSGYKTVSGYERFDGRPSPSAAAYATMDVSITGSFSDGDTVTGLTSGATGVITANGVVTTGSPDYIVVTKLSGIFVAGESLQVSGATEGTVITAAVIDGADSNKLHSQYKNYAADVYRADIAVVPGSGNILGIWQLNGTKYAFRNNAGGTAAAMYKSSTAGWVLVDLGRELGFSSGGTTEISVGDTITGATSGATAVVTLVMLESGSWSGGTAAGKIIFATQTGTFQAEDLNVGASTNLATIAGDSSAITLLPDGRYEFYTSNFGGQAGTEKIYGCDGVNRGFEFDGQVFAPITTGMNNDAPTHVVVHRNHLFFSFAGSAQHSGIGTPYAWTPVFGASELATGKNITGFVVEPGAEGNATLGIYNDEQINILYGTSTLTWNLVKYREDVGAFAYSMQKMSTTFFMGDRGITDLRTTQRYGNFQHATYSRKIQDLINLKKTLVSASCVVREKNQYRIFFSDNTAIYVTLSQEDAGGIMGMMPISFNVPVLCAYSHDRVGEEEILFGSSNGFVYQMDKGTSFDGDNILAYFVTHFDFQKALRWLKKYMDVTLEVSGEGYAEFSMNSELSYGDSGTPAPESGTTVMDLTSRSGWDNGNWDTGFWDGSSLKPAMIDLGGSGENIALTLQSESDYYDPLLFSGAYIHYTLRRLLRNNR